MLSHLNQFYPEMKFDVAPDPNGVDRVIIRDFMPFPSQITVSRYNYNPYKGKIEIGWPQCLVESSAEAARFSDALLRASQIAGDFDYYLRHYAM